MITSVIGKIFLDAYNERYGTKYDAKSFFANVYFPLFFNSPKYLMWVQNSPFVQNLKAEKWTSQEALERMNTLFEKVGKGYRDASVAIGFPASEEKGFATTSGQVTNMNFGATEDEVYLSWMGSSLGVGVAGAVNILFSDKRILLDIFEGWQYYRNAIDNNEKMKGNQCTTWNAQWLAHRYSKYYEPTKPMADFDPFENCGGEIRVRMQTWTKVLMGISEQYRESRLMSYLYNFGQMNRTFGFIPFLLDEIRRPKELYKKFFKMDGEKAEKLYGTEKGLLSYCSTGVIGLMAMEPKGMEEYVQGKKMPKYDENNEERLINFRTYQIWILAMLNNQDLWDKSKEFAKTIHHYETNDDKALSKKRTNAVKTILEATNKKNFIEALTAIVEELENKEQIIAIANEVNVMPTDNVPYFLTLVRFQYASIK